MTATPKSLRVEALRERPVRVDKDNKVIYGYVVAQEGPFKDLRGEFDEKALKMIVSQMRGNQKGLRSRFTHPSMSDDGLGKYLGRAKNAWLDRSSRVLMVRADLHLSESSFDTPSGDLGNYILNLAAEDSDALSSSLVLEAEEEYRLNPDKTPMRSDDGEMLPPLWRPKKLWATDIVDTGAAVDGLLSAQLSPIDLPGAEQRLAWSAMQRLFATEPDDVIRARVDAFLEKFLDYRKCQKPAENQQVLQPSTPLLNEALLNFQKWRPNM
jgi:hypothetical protein